MPALELEGNFTIRLPCLDNPVHVLHIRYRCCLIDGSLLIIQVDFSFVAGSGVTVIMMITISYDLLFEYDQEEAFIVIWRITE